MRAASAAASISSSVASGFAKRRLSRTESWKRYVSWETTPTRSLRAPEAQVAHVDAVDGDRCRASTSYSLAARYASVVLPEPVSPTSAVVVPAGTVKETSSQRPVLAVAEPDVVEDDVTGSRSGERVRLLDDVDRLVEVLEDAIEERKRGLHVQPDSEQRPDREEQPRLQRGERDEESGSRPRSSRARARARRTSRRRPA